MALTNTENLVSSKIFRSIHYETNIKKQALQRQIIFLNNLIRDESIKIENKSGFWQPDQIEKWKIKRYTYIKKQKEIKSEFPEYFL